MNLACMKCGQAIVAEDINLDRLLAKCRHCNTVFDFSAQLGRGEGTGAPEARTLQRRRAAVPLPPGLRVLDDETSAAGQPYRIGASRPTVLRIERRWFSASRHVFMLFFCIAWDAFLVFWYSHATKGGWLFVVFPIAHVAVGVGMTYSVLAGFLNRSIISVDGEGLSVRHGPLPWRGNRTIPRASLAQLFCEHVVSQSSDGTSNSYHLSAIVDGKKIRLLSNLAAPDQALYVEQRIEERLGIVDVAVGGEYAA